MGIINWLRNAVRSSPGRVEEASRRLTEKLSRLPRDEARAEGLRVLTSTPFETSPAKDDEPAQLPAALRGTDLAELFGLYESVTTASIRIHRSDLQALRGELGGFVIGSDLEHAKLVFDPADQSVWVLEPDQMEGDTVLAKGDQLPSIWHYIMEVAITSQPAWWLRV